MQPSAWSLAAALATLGCGWFATPAAGQDFRVYTVVRDEAANAGDAPIVARSLTLFRARKCYDWMEDVGEVVVTDRTHGRVEVVDRDLRGVRLLDEERRHFLKLGRREAEGYLTTIADRRTRASLAATIEPDLRTEWNAEAERLTLAGGSWRYDVATAIPPDPAYVDAYLDYADSACEVNFLLHPRSLYPAMRQALNAELRRLGRLPLSVTLSGDPGHPLKLTARHKYEWTLQPYDLSQIRRWEQLTQSDADSGADPGDGVDWMTIHDFQQASVATD